ncbi:hypothetical protein EV715DRAFT_275326 [Schizophyllum commune]
MAVLAPVDWNSPRDNTMDAPKQRSQSADPSQPTFQPPHPQRQQSQAQQPPAGPPFVFQQQPQGSWTPSIAAQPFYPSFYQNQQQPQQPQQQQQPYPPQAYLDPANAQIAQWAYHQMMVQQGYAMPPQMQHPGQRGSPQGAPGDFFSQNTFNPFPSGTPPPNPRTGSSTDVPAGPQFAGFHPYRRPNRQASHSSSDNNEWRPPPAQAPYARPEASGSSSSLNSNGSGGQRQRTNSNHSGQNVPSPVGPGGRRMSPSNSPSPQGQPSRTPHHRTGSGSSSSTATASLRQGRSPSVSSGTSATSTPSTATSTSQARVARPSPLSQGVTSTSEKRMSRDDSDLAQFMSSAPSDMTPGGKDVHRSGLKGRLRRALSLNASQTLQEENEDDDASIKASTYAATNGRKEATSAGKAPMGPDHGQDDGASTATVQTKKSRSLFNRRFNASTDNISLSSTVSSASVMIRKLGSMGKLARRNSLAGITSLFKDKEKDKEGDGKKSKKKKGKGETSEASVSHVTAEMDRLGSDWNAPEMAGLSPAAKLARQHTLKTNAEAAAKAKAEAEAAAASAAGGSAAGVATWDRNTHTRQGSASPVKGGGIVRVNEDGTRVIVEEDEDDDDRSDDAHYGTTYGTTHEGWNDDEDWDGRDEDTGDDFEEDVTITQPVNINGMTAIQRLSLDSDGGVFQFVQFEPQIHQPRDPEREKKPKKGILKSTWPTLSATQSRLTCVTDAGTYNQHSYLADGSTPAMRTRSNSYNAHPAQVEPGPLARMPSPDPDHIDGLHRHGSHSSHHSTPTNAAAPTLPPLSFDSTIAIGEATHKEQTDHIVSPSPTGGGGDRTSAIFIHPNSSAPALSTIAKAPSLTHRSATTPAKSPAFSNALSLWETFPKFVYDRRSEPATWSRLTPALAQSIKEELNSYKMEEMEVHAASRIHTQFFV